MIPVPSESDSTRAVSLRDLTDAEQGAHAIQCLVEDVEISLRNVWRCSLLRHRAPRLVNGLPRASMMTALPEAVARVAPGLTDCLISCPGIVVPHRPPTGPTALAGLAQMQGRGEPSHELSLLRVRTGRPLTTDSVDVMAHTVVTNLLPDLRSFPRECVRALRADAVEIRAGMAGDVTGIGDAGVVDRAALASFGLDPGRCSAILLRLDLDRVLMLRKGIDDVRLLRSEDPLVKGQLLELGRFRKIDEPGLSAGRVGA
jgi:phenylalanyl-tRNA synthetase alpha chain